MAKSGPDTQRRKGARDNSWLAARGQIVPDTVVVALVVWVPNKIHRHELPKGGCMFDAYRMASSNQGWR